MLIAIYSSFSPRMIDKLPFCAFIADAG